MWPHELDFLHRWYVTLPVAVIILWHEAVGLYAEQSSIDDDTIRPAKLFSWPDGAIFALYYFMFGLALWALVRWLYGLVSPSERVHATLFYLFYGASMVEPFWLLFRRRFLWPRKFVSRRIKLLRASLGRVDYPDRITASQQLGRFGPRASRAVPVLLEHALWRGGSNLWESVRGAASTALGGIGEARAVAALVSILQAWIDNRPLPHYPPDRPILHNTLSALSRIGPAAARAVPVLIHFLSVPPPAELAEHAIKTLGHIGPAARMSVPALKRLAQLDPSAAKPYSAQEVEGLKYEAGKALERIGSAA